MLRLLKDRQLRRFLIATCFALAFVWVAVRWFNVDRNVVYVFAILAFVLVAVLILFGFVFSFLLHLYMRRGNGMLSKIEEEEKALQERAEQAPHEDDDDD